MKKFFLVLVFAMIPFYLGAMGNKKVEYKVFDLVFRGPAGMVLADIGASPGKILEFSMVERDVTNRSVTNSSVLRVIFYRFPKGAQKVMGGKSGLMQYGKTTILATAKPAKKIVKRKFFKKKIKGEVLRMSIPTRSYAEAYVIPIPGKKQYLFLGIKADASYPPEKVEKIISLIAKSLK